MVLLEDLLINLKKEYNFPDKFFHTLPKKCVHCGSPFLISGAITQLECSNTRCKGKVLQRLKIMCELLEIDRGIAKKYLSIKGLDNHLTLFYFPYEEKEIKEKVGVLESQILERQLLKLKDLPLQKYLLSIGLTNIKDLYIEFLLYTYDIEVLYKELKLYIKDIIENKSDITLEQLKCYETLLLFEKDIIQGYKCLNGYLNKEFK